MSITTLRSGVCFAIRAQPRSSARQSPFRRAEFAVAPVFVEDLA
jgi:hypothetical protein